MKHETRNVFIAGDYKQKYEYKSFSPSLINKPFEWQDKKINLLLLQEKNITIFLMILLG